MKLEFSPALQLAFDRARQIAVGEHSAEVMPRHLLRGLLAEEEGKAVALLIQSGTDWPRLQSHLGASALGEAGPADLPLHASLPVVMLQAGELAVQHGDEGSI